jgi:hypothetical protein
MPTFWILDEKLDSANKLLRARQLSIGIRGLKLYRFRDFLHVGSALWSHSHTRPLTESWLRSNAVKKSAICFSLGCRAPPPPLHGLCHGSRGLARPNLEDLEAASQRQEGALVQHGLHLLLFGRFQSRRCRRAPGLTSL